MGEVVTVRVAAPIALLSPHFTMCDAIDKSKFNEEQAKATANADAISKDEQDRELREALERERQQLGTVCVCVSECIRPMIYERVVFSISFPFHL